MRNFLRELDAHFEECTASLLFVAFSTLMFINVVMRYVFSQAIPWASELTLLLFVWFVWLAIPYATKLNTHARVSFIQDWLSPRNKALLNILLSLFTVVICVSIVLAAIEFLGHNAVRGKTGLLVPYPMWLFYIPAPIGLSLTIYRLLQNLADDIGPLAKGLTVAKE